MRKTNTKPTQEAEARGKTLEWINEELRRLDADLKAILRGRDSPPGLIF
ncbi:MAG: hypothetical protein Q8P13_01890 [bacterium]|nr:hypothetical protein [bacterium]